MMATEVVLRQEGKDRAQDQCFHVQAAFCGLYLDINRGEPCTWWWNRTAVTITDLEGSQKTVVGPTLGGWASAALGG